MDDYGIFNSEGLIEGGFYSEEEAQDCIKSYYENDDDMFVSKVCEHYNEADYCDECGDFE